MEDDRAQIGPSQPFRFTHRRTTIKVARGKRTIELVLLKQSGRFRQDHFLCSRYPTVHSNFRIRVAESDGGTTIAQDTLRHPFRSLLHRKILPRQRPQGLCALTASTWRKFGPMTLKIERHVEGRRVIFQLVGNLRLEHLDELKTQISGAGRASALDVGGISLISVEGIRFLNSCAASGISIANASPYISKWMVLERRFPETREKQRL
jgi:hypothetical protein